MNAVKGGAIAAVVLACAAAAPPVLADDACTVVLCLSFSKWDEIGQCVPPVRRALRDAALGKPPKKCKMGSADNSASGGEAQADSLPADRNNCPQGHWRGRRCEYDGVIRVSVDGQTWTNTWWDRSGNTASQVCPGAPAVTQQDASSLEALLARTQQLDTYADAAAHAGALSTYQPAADCVNGEECAPEGAKQPPIPADQNCAAIEVANDGAETRTEREPVDEPLLR
jgi:hypothetical protein